MSNLNLNLGKIGIWTGLLDREPVARAKEVSVELEEMGYGAIWIPESVGRDSLVNACMLLEATKRFVVATGIANIYARDAVAMASGRRSLGEAYPDRFLLGLGVSHEPLVSGVRGHDWQKPLEYLRSYLEDMGRAPYRAYPPKAEPPICIGALGPKALVMAAELTWGAHPYNVTAGHTAWARDLMGPDALLAPMASVTLETDPVRAREIGRKTLGFYLELPNYRKSLIRQGFDEDDFFDGGSDRLIDALRPWGDIDTVVESVKDHLTAGANHVCVQVMDLPEAKLPVDEWRRLASALVD